MARTSRYFFAPMTQNRIGWKLTFAERIRRYIHMEKKRREIRCDVFEVTGYWY